MVAEAIVNAVAHRDYNSKSISNYLNSIAIGSKRNNKSDIPIFPIPITDERRETTLKIMLLTSPNREIYILDGNPDPNFDIND